MSSQEHPRVRAVQLRAVQYVSQSVAWGAAPSVLLTQPAGAAGRQPLYTPEQRVRRDTSVWTWVQGVLAPVQFLVFLVSVVLVLRYLFNGEGLGVAQASVVVKTGVLYTIMLTGCIWEKVVFDRWLFAPAFFWEDVFSMLVLALHTAYVYALFTDALTPRGLMGLALAAYAAYAINAAQFIWKLRMARLDEAARRGTASARGGA
jgi:3-vinyl bacteriochlorophyllide hydratase